VKLGRRVKLERRVRFGMLLRLWLALRRAHRLWLKLPVLLTR
jgi:hypothetical protein